MERIKFKKEMLLEMRTDGEITKQEFLDQRKKLDKELQELQAEYDSKAHNPVIEMDQPELISRKGHQISTQIRSHT